MLVELTREFIRMYGEKKREKNILDFTDMEHFALEILIQRVHAAEENGENDGNWTGESKYIYHMSPAARELSLKYDEVMVDEYQDSNLVQEMITNCVSGWADGRKNIFMVGDVKQSIYRFRLARPELFMEKYEQYSLTDSTEQRIDMNLILWEREVTERLSFIKISAAGLRYWIVQTLFSVRLWEQILVELPTIKPQLFILELCFRKETRKAFFLQKFFW